MSQLDNRSRSRFFSILVFLGFLGLWQVVATAELISPVFFPAPQKCFVTLYEQMNQPEFWQAFSQTISRMIVGFSIAAFCGVTLGAIIGLSSRARTYIEPTLELIRPLPASAIIPVFILLMGLNDSMIVAVILFSSLWPVLLNTVHGFKTVEPRLLEVAQILHLSQMEVIFKIALPNAMADIFAGLRLSLTVSLILAVVAEMLAGTTGLGQNITLAARSFRSADLYAGIMVLGAVGYITNTALAKVERHVLRWRAV
jgi:ABC-type nitrate/sulfonate/bicarbonate transport system permease component